MPAKVWVIGGTDTEVGKTRTGVALASVFRDLNQDIIAVKPIESGVRDLTLETEDGALLARATGQSFPERALIRLNAPVAPPAAADLEGRTLSWNDLLAEVKEIISGRNFALVEGAGGILSPLTWDSTTLDLAVELNAEMVLVVSDRLGSLNQTRMAMAACESRGVPVSLVVLSAGKSGDHTTGYNLESLARCAEFRGEAVPSLIELPCLDEGDSGKEHLIRWAQEKMNDV